MGRPGYADDLCGNRIRRPGVGTPFRMGLCTTRITHLVDSLESFKAYWFCVSAIGTAGEGMQSDPAMGRAA